MKLYLEQLQAWVRLGRIQEQANMLADSIVVHQDDRAAIVRCHAEIDEVAGRIANGAAICCAPWRDTEARGWLWYCSLPLGHDGHHRRIGATW